MGAHAHHSPTRHTEHPEHGEGAVHAERAGGGGGLPFPVGAVAATALLASAVVTTGGVSSGTANAEPIENPTQPTGQPAAEHTDPTTGPSVVPAADVTDSTDSDSDSDGGSGGSDGDAPDSSCGALGGVIDTGLIDSALDDLTGTTTAAAHDCTPDSASSGGPGTQHTQGSGAAHSGAGRETGPATATPAAPTSPSSPSFPGGSRPTRPRTSTAPGAAGTAAGTGDLLDAPLAPGQTRTVPISGAATRR